MENTTSITYENKGDSLNYLDEEIKADGILPFNLISLGDS